MANNTDTHTGNPRVAPTAYFTASAWAAGGFAGAELFDTWVGRSLYTPVARLSAPARWLTPSLAHFIEFLWLRHQWLEARLRELEPGLVIEIGAGLSSRGVAVAELHPQLDYLELDLPHMVAAKRRLLRQTKLPRNYRLACGDLLSADFAVRLPDRWRGPVVVITEGVCDYLDYDQKRLAWRNIANLLQELDGGCYLMEVNTRERIATYGPAARGLTTLLGWLTGDNFDARLFQTADQALQSLLACGFDEARLLDTATLDCGGLEVPDAPCFFDLIEARVG